MGTDPGAYLDKNEPRRMKPGYQPGNTTSEDGRRLKSLDLGNRMIVQSMK